MHALTSDADLQASCKAVVTAASTGAPAQQSFCPVPASPKAVVLSGVDRARVSENPRQSACWLLVAGKR